MYLYLTSKYQKQISDRMHFVLVSNWSEIYYGQS